MANVACLFSAATSSNSNILICCSRNISYYY